MLLKCIHRQSINAKSFYLDYLSPVTIRFYVMFISLGLARADPKIYIKDN